MTTTTTTTPTTTPTTKTDPAVKRIAPPVWPDRARLFYTAAAGILLVLMALGFQHFYLQGKAYPGRELTPPIRTVVILHGVTMTVWMLLFLIQPLLIVAGKRRVHMALGRVGAVLAAAIVIFGLRVGIESARVNPPEMRLWDLSPKQFMTVPLISILVFAGFVIAGVWNRRRPHAHRPMMLLAVLAVMPAAIDRIDAIQSLYRGTIFGTVFGPFFSTLVVGLILLIAERLLTRAWNRWFVTGFAMLVVVDFLTMQLATTAAWDRFATYLLQV